MVNRARSSEKLASWLTGSPKFSPPICLRTARPRRCFCMSPGEAQILKPLFDIGLCHRFLLDLILRVQVLGRAKEKWITPTMTLPA